MRVLWINAAAEQGGDPQVETQIVSFGSTPQQSKAEIHRWRPRSCPQVETQIVSFGSTPQQSKAEIHRWRLG
jgi:hypothetical protein